MNKPLTIMVLATLAGISAEAKADDPLSSVPFAGGDIVVACGECSSPELDWVRYRNSAWNSYQHVGEHYGVNTGRRLPPQGNSKRSKWVNFQIAGTAPPSSDDDYVLVAFKVFECDPPNSVSYEDCDFSWIVETPVGVRQSQVFTGSRTNRPTNPDTLPYPSGDPNYDPPGGPCSLTPTHVARLPMTGTAATNVLTSSIVERPSREASAESENTIDSDSGQRRPPKPAAPLPRMWLQDRGPDYMASRIAPVRFKDGTLSIYYNAHEQNGREMHTVPGVTLSSVATPELPDDVRQGVVQIDLWEDEQVHSVKLWLSNGRTIDKGALVERIKDRISADYGDEPRRHRVILFQRFRLTEGGRLDTYGESFSYQPQCCPGNCRESPAHCFPN